MRSRSANLVIAAMYIGLKSTSSIFALLPFGICPSSASICLMIPGAADPPYLALNFTPFHDQGLWLEVIITPPAVSMALAQYEIAGVGNTSLLMRTGIPAAAIVSAAACANDFEPNRVS